MVCCRSPFCDLAKLRRYPGTRQPPVAHDRLRGNSKGVSCFFDAQPTKKPELDDLSTAWIFPREAALDREPAERSSFVREAYADDSGLRRRWTRCLPKLLDFGLATITETAAHRSREKDRRVRRDAGPRRNNRPEELATATTTITASAPQTSSSTEEPIDGNARV